MTPTVRILVVGDALLDVLATPSRPPAAGSDVPASIDVAPGGQAANLAVRLARRGIVVGLVAPIGRDAAGTLLRARLAADGVQHLGPEGAETGTVVVLRDATGERTMLSRRVPLEPVVAAVRSASAAAWAVVSGYALLDPVADRIVEAVGTASRRVVVGCALTAEDAPAWRERADRLHPDLLVVNRDEAIVLGSLPPAPVVAVTHAAGAVLRVGDDELSADVPAGPPAVDTTGAGDAFAAALLGALADRETWPPPVEVLARALEGAVALAASVARVPGAQTRVLLEDGGTLTA